MSLLIDLKNEKGFALIAVYLASAILLTLSGTAYLRAFTQAKSIEHEIATMNAYYQAEAGLQAAVAQIGVSADAGGAYIGSIDTDVTAINNSLEDFMSADGNEIIGTVETEIEYPGEADWAVVHSQAEVNNRQVRLEGRVFLDSTLSNHMMYSTALSQGLGSNLQFGFPNTDPGASAQGVPANEVDRNLLYYKGYVSFNGTGINLWGDLFVGSEIYGNNYAGNLFGDAYVTNYATDPITGYISNDGVTNGGNLQITDGFSDDVDRNGSGTVTSADAPDIHELDVNSPLTDAKAPPELTPLDQIWYANNNDVPALSATAGTRFLKMETGSDGISTKLVEYTNGNFTTPTGVVHALPANGVAYVNGSVYVKGEVTGRVSLVSSENIYFADHVKYSGTSPTSMDASHSAAYMAKKKIFFLPNNLEMSGILYSQNDGNTNGIGVDATYKLDTATGLAVYDGGASKSGGHFRHYGNIITNNGGLMNTSVYGADRKFMYDENAKYYRAQGVPITEPKLRVVREIEPE